MIPVLSEYEQFVYSLQARFSSIETSTLVVKRTSAGSAQVVGTSYFNREMKLRIFETIDFVERCIEDYSYEIYQGDEKLCWYDCWPHPDDPTLAATFPHHKHIPPDIKHHRVPAPHLSFEHPNLPVLIQEAEALTLQH